VYNGKEKNSFVYYEDAGDGFDYQKGKFCKRVITFDPANRQLLLTKQERAFTSHYKKLQIIFHGFGDSINNEQLTTLKDCNIKILDGLHYLEDIYDTNYFQQLRSEEKMSDQKTMIIDNTENEIILKW
jgi:hypothetical protein